MFSTLAFVAPSALGASTFVGAEVRSNVRIHSAFPAVHTATRKTNRLNVSMTALSDKQTATAGSTDNPDGIDYKTYDYVGVWGFSPLSNTNWFAAGSSTPGGITDWTATMNVNFDRIDNPSITVQHPVQVQVTSYNNNSYRVRFNPDGPIRDVTRGPILKQQLDWIRTQELSEGCDPGMTFTSEGFLTFETKDLSVIIYGNFKTRVTRKADGKVIMENDEVGTASSGNKCRGLMFVDRLYGNAIASVNKNFRNDAVKQEGFYGAGEVNCKYQDTYILERTGIAMTNYNYDNLNYNQWDLRPPHHDGALNPDYYIPMYYAAPWLIVNGCAGTSEQYSYGWFMDNVSQSYMNTGDTTWNSGQEDLAYMGAQYGPFDQHFVYGAGGGMECVVTAFSLLQGKEFENQVLNKRSVMPPKYVFGFFQGVFGTSSLLRAHMPAGENNISVEEIVEGYQNNNFPFEGLAVDVDMQDNLRVFTTKGEFWTANRVGTGGDPNNRSVFEWAHDKGLVCQTNITCFLRNDNEGQDYEVNQTLRERQLYTKNDSLTGTDFGMTDDGPSDAYIGHLDYGGGVECDALFPDWGRPDVAEWWGNNYKKLFSIGLDFVWQDMTVPAMMPHKIGDDINVKPDGNWPNADDPSNGQYNWKTYHPQVLVTDMRYENHGREPMVTQRNIHAYTLCESTRKEGIVENADTLTKFRRSYIISRGGYIGNQHFGGMWVGDNSTTSNYIQMMIANNINMNMSCLPLVGSDIGGFTSYDNENQRTPCTGDLMVRYVQAGCLLPWFRNHYDRWIESKDHGKDYQELYMYPNEMDTLRKFVEFRYRWQEVLYTAMYQNAAFGKPIIKAASMYNNDSNVRRAQNDHFLLGGHDGYRILCAPVVWENSTERELYLPVLTQWYKFGPDFDTKPLEGAMNGGDRIYNYPVPQSESPIFVREGAILPTRYTLNGENKSLNTYTDEDPLVFEVFPLGNNRADGMCYLDDGGVTTNAEDNGKFSVVKVAAEQDGGMETITFTNDCYEYVFGGPFYVRVRGAQSPSNIHVSSGAGSQDMKVSSATSRAALFNDGENGDFWVDQETDSLWLKLPNVVLPDAVITIT
ncbi:Alpha-glucosidase 2 [Gracilariopsis chorda]|uniref:Alpha-glucosidase 2 n=1 Tax=Gracilariopsis chorda TaxID=448386 RepID=A0A2V3IN79_9FLOR|nr:Alpha-glucosidase 2 [Gracilariopsis chorda]|eukprot:PXF43517.1 Alpha-glucosidase 2 [Gracilariopsis chorda]